MGESLLLWVILMGISTALGVIVGAVVAVAFLARAIPMTIKKE